MKVLILAAGLGSRLNHLTNHGPKALVQIRDKAILKYQLDALISENLTDLGIVVGYKGQKIIDFINRFYPSLNCQFFWNHEFDQSNSSYSFWLAHEWIQGFSYLHMNCDVIFSAQLLRKLVQHPKDNVIAVRTNVPLGGKLEHVTLDKDKITAMSITRMPHSVGKAYGLAKLNPESTRFLSSRIRCHLDGGDKNQNFFGIIRQAVSQIDYFALDANSDTLLEVNTMEDLVHVTKIMAT